MKGVKLKYRISKRKVQAAARAAVDLEKKYPFPDAAQQIQICKANELFNRLFKMYELERYRGALKELVLQEVNE